MADGQAQLFLGRIGRYRRNELSVLDRIDEETTENFVAVRRADEGSIGSKQEDPSHATVQGSATSSSDEAIARLLAAAMCGEDLSMQVDDDTINLLPLPSPLTYEETVGAAAAPSSSPPQLEQRKGSNLDVFAEARRFGLDSDFLSALPREMALVLLDEARRENELLRYHGSDIEQKNSLSVLSTEEGTNPAMEEETLHDTPVDKDHVSSNVSSWLLYGQVVAVGQVLVENDVLQQYNEDSFPPEDEGLSSESHRSSSLPYQVSSCHQEDSFAREGAASLRHTMEAASSYSEAIPSLLKGRDQQSARSEVVSHNSALPSQSSRRISHNNRRRKSSMMRVAICSLAQRDAQRVSELSRLYSLAYNEGWSMKN